MTVTESGRAVATSTPPRGAAART
ncbi:MAG: hypothetical protein QOG96_5704, partial [Pseudonocardiales bacterium]|nr:hypothetical protein [Pseudonocardiales bacterium]